MKNKNIFILSSVILCLFALIISRIFFLTILIILTPITIRLLRNKETSAFFSQSMGALIIIVGTTMSFPSDNLAMYSGVGLGLTISIIFVLIPYSIFAFLVEFFSS